MYTNFDNIVIVKWVYECVERDKSDGYSNALYNIGRHYGHNKHTKGKGKHYFFVIYLILYCENFLFDLVCTKKNFNMFRLTLSLVGKWPVNILKFRLGS